MPTTKIKPIAYITVRDKKTGKVWEETLDNLDLVDNSTTIIKVTVYAVSVVNFFNQIAPPNQPQRQFIHSRIAVQTERRKKR